MSVNRRGFLGWLASAGAALSLGVKAPEKPAAKPHPKPRAPTDPRWHIVFFDYPGNEVARCYCDNGPSGKYTGMALVFGSMASYELRAPNGEPVNRGLCIGQHDDTQWHNVCRFSSLQVTPGATLDCSMTYTPDPVPL